ncbi:MAG: FAD-dependent monooxygenase [Labilithrix sp.]|nr:FAD-dependent monooxygenase [Labilithrix sp.]
MGKSAIGIVGGGIAGLTVAHALRSDGFDVTIFERASTLRAGGGALILWSNAIHALSRLDLDGRLLEKRSVQEVERGEFVKPSGELLSTIPIGDVARTHGAPSVVLARADLLQLLGEAAGPVQVDAHVRKVFAKGNDVIVRFASGAESRFDAVIGADGLHSVVRGAVGAEQPLRSAGQDLCVATTAHWPAELVRGTVTATLGAGLRFWTAALGDGRTFWYAVFPSDASVQTLDALAALYSDWHDPIPRLIRETQPEHAWWTPMRDRDPSPSWGRGNITLVGDSAHAMTPDLGQGACQAIESGLALRDAIRESPDLATAFRSYERRRFPRTADITRLAWVVANTCGATSPIQCLARDTAVRFGMRPMFMTQLDWLFRGTS